MDIYFEMVRFDWCGTNYKLVLDIHFKFNKSKLITVIHASKRSDIFIQQHMFL